GSNAWCSMCAETIGTVKHSPVLARRSKPRPSGVCILPVPASTAAPVHGPWRCLATPSSRCCCQRRVSMTCLYDMPVFKAVKVHPDHHAEVAKALYSLPECWIGHTLDVRADAELVKFYHHAKLVKVHPRQPAGGRSTDRADLPEHKAGYALRDLTAL